MLLLEQVPGAPMDIEFPRTTVCLTIMMLVAVFYVIAKNKKE